MKHLKKFTRHTRVGLSTNESYVLPENIIQDIKDICLELNDMGFQVFTNQLGFNSQVRNVDFYPNLSIYKYGKAFEYNEVEEVIERLARYMQGMDYQVSVKKIMSPTARKNTVLKEVNIKFI